MLLPIIELLRVEEDDRYGTFGILRIAKQLFCVTLEPSDRLNAPNISSIPAQQYICRRVNSPKFGQTFEITNIPGRSHVLFHPGNRIDDTLGCVILAQHVGKLRGNRAVLNSGATFEAFMGLMKREGITEFHFTVKEEY